MPEKPSPNAAATVNRPTSSASQERRHRRRLPGRADQHRGRPPNRSAIAPQTCRLMNAVPSSTDSITAPNGGVKPRSLQNATRCCCGIDIGHAAQHRAAHIIANTTFGGQPSTRARAASRRAARIGAGSRAARGRTDRASGRITTISNDARRAAWSRASRMRRSPARKSAATSRRRDRCRSRSAPAPSRGGGRTSG